MSENLNNLYYMPKKISIQGILKKYKKWRITFSHNGDSSDVLYIEAKKIVIESLENEWDT